MSHFKKDDVDLNFNNGKLDNDNHAKEITMFYKAIYQINDIVLGLVFLIGSFLFFSDSTMVMGTVLFVIGSLQMTARPVISFVHDLKLSNYYRKAYHNQKKHQ